jgi:hypothetical protein
MIVAGAAADSGTAGRFSDRYHRRLAILDVDCRR